MLFCLKWVIYYWREKNRGERKIPPVSHHLRSGLFDSTSIIEWGYLDQHQPGNDCYFCGPTQIYKHNSHFLWVVCSIYAMPYQTACANVMTSVAQNYQLPQCLFSHLIMRRIHSKTKTALHASIWARLFYLLLELMRTTFYTPQVTHMKVSHQHPFLSCAKTLTWKTCNWFYTLFLRWTQIW